MVHKILEEFISSCKEHSHYEHLNECPSHFEEWTEKRHLRHDYHKWIRKESNLPSLRLDIDFPFKEVYDEAMNAEVHLIKHRGSAHPGWESMAVHGQAVWATDPPKNNPELEGVDFHWTELADICPRTVEWFKDCWPTQGYQRIRFMMLRDGGFIRPHQDLDRRELSAMNIALNNPDGCEFAMEDAGIIPWVPGDVRLIDVGRRHCVWNQSGKDRLHMIVHDKWTPAQYDIVCRSYDLLKRDYLPFTNA